MPSRLPLVLDPAPMDRFAPTEAPDPRSPSSSPATALLAFVPPRLPSRLPGLEPLVALLRLSIRPGSV